MRQPRQVKRYALARTQAAKPGPEERLRRLRLVRMEAIADLDRGGERAAGQLDSSAESRS